MACAVAFCVERAKIKIKKNRGKQQMEQSKIISIDVDISLKETRGLVTQDTFDEISQAVTDYETKQAEITKAQAEAEAEAEAELTAI